MASYDTHLDRRDFLVRFGALSAGALILPQLNACTSAELFFHISLAEWSFHRALQANEMSNLDFPVRARKEFDIGAVEYVNRFFIDKPRDTDYLKELNNRCKDNGVKSMLIMCDDLGEIGNTDAEARAKVIENHFPWVDAAHFLGCHSIRVNCAGKGTPEEVAQAGMDGLRALSEYAQQAGINVIVENHGGSSSNGEWLSNVIKSVGMSNCGTLPDFGNFQLADGTWYDRYKGVGEMMPFAKAVSAKTHNFDDQGNCVETDYVRMLKIVKDAGYHGYIGIEYEGEVLSEADGIRATKKLLERAGATVS